MGARIPGGGGGRGGGLNGGGAGFGAQFSISVTGNAAADLAAIAGALRTVTDASGETALAVRDAANQFSLLLESTQELEHLGHQMMGLGEKILHGVAHPFAEAIKEAAELETQSIALKSAFRELNEANFDNLQKRIQQISISSPFPMKEINEIVTALKNVGNVDLSKTFDGAGKRMKETGIAFMTDLAAGTGRSLNDVLFATRIMLSEQGAAAFTSFKRRLHLGGAEAMKQVLMQAGESFDMSTPQKRLETLFKFISIKFGGLSQSLTNSAGGMIAVIKDTVRVGVFNAIQDSFNRYKSILFEVKSFLDSLFSDETDKARRFRDTFKGVLTTIGDVFAGVAEIALKVARVVTDWMGENPELSKFITRIVLGAGAFLTFGGAALIVVGVLGKVLALLGGIAGGLTLGIKLLGNIFIGLRAVSTAAFLLVGIPYLLYQAYRTNFGGIADTVEKVLMVFEGLFQLISSNHGEIGQISADLAAHLRMIPGFFGGSLLDDVVSLFMLFGRLRLAVLGFKEGFSEAMKGAKEAFEPVFRLISRGLGVLATWLGVHLTQAGHTNAQTWKDWGRIIGQVATTVLILVTAIRFLSSGLSLAVNIAKLAGIAFSALTALLELNPFVLAATAIVAIGAALYLWLAADEDTRAKVREGWDSLVDWLKAKWDSFTSFVDDFNIGQFMEGVRVAMVSAMDYIREKLSTMFTADNMSGLLGGFKDFSDRAGAIFADALKMALTAGSFLISVAFALASAIVGALHEEVRKTFGLKEGGAVDTALSATVFAPEAILGMAAEGWKGIADVLGQAPSITNTLYGDNEMKGKEPAETNYVQYPFAPAAVPVQQGAGNATSVSNGGSGQVKVEVKHAPQSINILLDGRQIYQQIVKHDDQEYVRAYGSNEAFGG